jgi:transposase
MAPKNYRERQAKAQRLHAEGLALRDIARELDTDVDTVRAWIEKGQ